MNNILPKDENATSALHDFFVTIKHERTFEDEGIKLSKQRNWKKQFYKAYRRKNHALASSIYFSKHPYRADMMDVHQGYKLEKRTDKELLIAVITLILIVLSTIIGIVHIYKS